MNILITGGSGLVGTRLTQMLLEKGYQVSHLSRRPRNKPNVVVYKWDVNKKEIAQKAIATADAIVHLAGAGVADKRWSAARKKEIMNSRVDSGKLLVQSLRHVNHSVKTFISASGMGYYGDCGDRLLKESDSLGRDFLAKVCDKWEASTEDIIGLGIRRVVLRIGIVLDKNGGALPKMAQPIKMGMGSYFGNGKQIYSWIHIDDLCRMIIFSLKQNQVKGIYNAASPDQVSNIDFTKELAAVFKRPFIPIPVPMFGLKMVLGQMAETLLTSTAISPDKIMREGFSFSYADLGEALEEIY